MGTHSGPLPAGRAVFLDRDGVLIRPFIKEGRPFPAQTLGECELLPGVVEACRRLKSAGWLLVVATNQPDVGRGTLRREVVEAIHRTLQEILPLDRIEVCYDAGRAATPCPDRKPAPGMLLRAAREMKVDLGRSFMVGDRWRDIDCGKAAGCRTIFVDWDYEEELRERPDHRVRDLAEAADWILQQN